MSITHDGSRRTMEAQKDRRMERKVEAARAREELKAKLTDVSLETIEDDMKQSMATFRAGQDATKGSDVEGGEERPDWRERRLSGDSLASTHIAIAKLGDDDDGKMVINAENVQVNNLRDLVLQTEKELEAERDET